MNSSILPNVLDIARQYNIVIYPTRNGKPEHQGDCPFCGGKKCFQINTEKNVFLCNRQNHCGVRGGVLKLMELLTGNDQKELLRELVAKNGSLEYSRKTARIRKLHPALNIPREDLRKIKLDLNNPDWYNRTLLDWNNFYKKYPERTKDELDLIWFMYKRYKKRREQILNDLIDQINAHKLRKKILKILEKS
jgi:hypothetical protein